jgi:hypothetical protein
MHAINSFGKPEPAIRIKLRDDSPSSIVLEGGLELNPGEEADVEHGLAIRLLNTGRATRIVADPAPVDETEEEKVDETAEEVPPGTTETPTNQDPKPSRKRG